MVDCSHRVCGRTGSNWFTGGLPCYAGHDAVPSPNNFLHGSTHRLFNSLWARMFSETVTNVIISLYLSDGYLAARDLVLEPELV